MLLRLPGQSSETVIEVQEQAGQVLQRLSGSRSGGSFLPKSFAASLEHTSARK
ncbi:MAG: hypothetical protein M3436_00575 [Pseudomonadota bacterium]|nr:hypothetical protein [Pseudomonadota bacterium]